ncbi:MAG: 1-deoxy-D-xylulose-5-phosphate reductoisomerase [Deltaproteobacteria bacterium]|nr:1-deoxy-D-xylulose-5-phosphate reductoisomerase [Deltaproteobacteria bacterium]
MGYISRLDVSSLLARPRRRIVILGSTGSIGRSALDVIRRDTGAFEVLGLAGARNLKLLAEQAATWRPTILSVLEPEDESSLRGLLPRDYKPEILSGAEGYCAMAGHPDADMVLSAQAGAAGLAPTLAAIEAGKVVALANKESMVLAGPVIKKVCVRSGAVILPVDSEHNALFQALQGHNPREVDRILLTASGGPFRSYGPDALQEVTPAQALRHPNWAMGPKITIDSATLMNKGLELIEAVYLFDCGVSMIEILIHPQSIVHSMIQYRDGSVLAQMGPPDMRIPISYALHFPLRGPAGVNPLDFFEVGALTFERPREDVFPALRLAREAIAAGPDFPVVLNAANEVAVQAFLDGRIPFTAIVDISRRALDAHRPAPARNVDEILAMDADTRRLATEMLDSGGVIRS